MDFTRLLAYYQSRVNDALLRFISPLPFQGSLLLHAIQYGVLSEGKRLRSFLVYTVGDMLGVDIESLDVPAAAIESIHAYSLIHDDLPAMDGNNLRRGQPTCHIKFGESIAILAGDALQALAFSILSDAPMHNIQSQDRISMISELAKASGAAGMCGGQALDLASEGKTPDLDAIETIHRYKTGAIIRSAIRLAVLAAGEQSRYALPLLNRYADAIGVAFQVQDDILDIEGNSTITGKQQGLDQKLRKSTYPALIGLDNARQKAQMLLQDAQDILDQLNIFSLDTSMLRALASFIIERDK